MSFSAYTTLKPEAVFPECKTRPEGLSSAEAAQRLQEHGRNAIEAKTATWRDFLWRQFASPFVFLLLGASFISFLLGQRIDAGMILLFVVINTALGFYQEFRSEQALRLLQKFIVARTLTLRDGTPRVVPSEELVTGDIVILRAGDIVPADIRLVQAEEFIVNESSLTGESNAIPKSAAPLAARVQEPYQATNIVFGGTTVSRGQARGVVIAVGTESVLGDISRLTVETKRRTGFEIGIAGFSRFVIRLITVTLALVFIANLIIKHGHVNFFELTIFSIALAIGVIPEALPVVTTLAMSRGALRLAKEKVVVRRLSAIEDLGSIDVLCSDKTGTLTRGQMSVHEVEASDRAECLRLGVIGASESDLQIQQSNNSFDLAIWSALDAEGQAAVKHARVLFEFPFDPERRRTTIAFQTDQAYQIVSRGAPEVILERSAVPEATRHQILETVRIYGQQGFRTFGVARRRTPHAPNAADLESDTGLEWVGLIAFSDPLKLSAGTAIRDAKELGVQVKIITGDSAEVAGTVGHQAGLITHPEDVLLGEALMALGEDGQRDAVEKYHVFARVSPQQKFRIIELLRRHHQVGYLGEGINDAPALKESNLSIVVDTASDIARSNADVILLQRNLSVIIEGIRQGRAVFANTIKYIKSTLLSNFGNFYAVAFASLLISYPPILPLQILLINLLSDFPMISIAADSVDPQEIRRPQVYQVREVALLASVLGSVSTLFDFMYFGFFSHSSQSVLQTNWFIGSILTELAILFSIRTKLPFLKAVRPPLMIFILTGVAAATTIALPYLPVGQHLFHFHPPTLGQLALTLGIVLVYFITSETVKNFYYRWRTSSEMASVKTP